jgi:hypothetical protein
MRNTLPTLSIPPSASSRPTQPASATVYTPHQPVPTIRLFDANPSDVGASSDARTPAAYNAYDLPSTSSPISPRPLTTSNASRKRLVPKKSKLGLLGAVKGNKERSQNDFSDVVRRIGGITSAGPGGYEIYVDHTEDPDLEEIVLVKKKKSRLGLDAVAWGASQENTGTLKPKTSSNALKPKSSENVPKLKSSVNVPKSKSKDKENSIKAKPVEHLLKPKSDESQKWWSIGRGRKDSKEQKEPRLSKCKLPFTFKNENADHNLDHSFQPQNWRKNPCVPGSALLIPGSYCPLLLPHPTHTHPILLLRTPRPCWPPHSIQNQNLALLHRLKEGLQRPPPVFSPHQWSEKSRLQVQSHFAR